jgi:hypothetical protein
MVFPYFSFFNAMNKNLRRLKRTRIFRLCGIGLLIVIGITKENSFGLAIPEINGEEPLSNVIPDPYIHTVLLRSADWEFSLPVIELNSDQQLELRFDDFSHQLRSFAYTIIHCDERWIKTPELTQEYLAGYEQGSITDKFSSFNTTYSYTHYRLLFPEENMKPLISGNYVIVVFNEDDPSEVFLIRRFYITENEVEIEAAVKLPGFGATRDMSQQVSVAVNYRSDEIRDPVNDVSMVVIQNNRYDKQYRPLKPYTVQQGRLDFAGPDDGIFWGGNEFRSLDIKSMKYQTENLAEIRFENPYYHVYMKPDENRSGKPYFSKTDLNGSYYISKEKAIDRHTDADYIYVHFVLSMPIMYANDKVYVAGAFTDWKYDESHQMKFNETTGYFELKLLIKQGLIDYCFVSSDGSEPVSEYDVEGSFSETENDYAVFVYFKDRRTGFDRLLGYQLIK